MTYTDIHATTSTPQAAVPSARLRRAMVSVGDLLKHARHKRGMSLDRVAKATRIPRSQLESLEEGRFDELPGETYVRGFLRSYAGAVGVDGDDALVTYATDRRSLSTTIRPIERVPPPKGRRLGIVVACSLFLLLLVVTALALSRPLPRAGTGELSEMRSAAESVLG